MFGLPLREGLVRAAFGCALAVAASAVFSAPADAQYNLYYGNFHAHCSLSDDAAGSGTPSAAFAYARDVANIDVMALTDHTHYMSVSEYVQLQQAANTATQNGVFVAICGQEHGSLSTSEPGAFGHVNIYEAASLIPQYNNGTDFRYNLFGTYAWIANNLDDTIFQPLVGSFNHPYNGSGAGIWAKFKNFEWDSTGDGAMKLIEVLNGKRSADYEPELFDALGKGWHVGALGNQDNHEGMWGNQPNNIGNIPLTGIWAPALTKSDMLQALAARRTFAMEVEPENDRWSLKVTADGHWMGSSYSTSADSVDFVVEVSAATPIASINLYRNGTLIRSTGVGATAFTWSTYDTPGPGDFYYLVRASQQDGDRAWSSPIWIESSSTFTTPIAQVNEDDGSGLPTMWFQTVTVQGLVTVDTDVLSATDNLFHVQDATGGLQVWKAGSQATPVALGQNVIVTGLVNNFQGMTFLDPSAITVVSSGAPPLPALITTQQLESSGESWEGALVVLHDVTIVGGEWPAAGNDGVVVIDDGSGPCDLFIDADTGVDDAGPPSETTFSVRGLVQQLDDSFPYFDGHRIVPRYPDDVFQIQGVGVSELPSHHGVTKTQLLPNWPNPFGVGTTIHFDLAGLKEQPAQIAAYDVSGRLVKTLVRGSFAPGSYEARWDGTDAQGARLAPGVYFLKLETPGATDSRKVVLLE
jgi:hypothetical protein